MRRVFFMTGLCLLACAPSQRALPALVTATDSDPAEGIVHVALRAQISQLRYGEGPSTAVWTYNGTVPGPLVEANVGDRLVVDFQNDLPESTTIHWHGVRVPNAMDGVALMENAIPAGGSFRYEFVLKDAGLFWFHPHVRADLQVRRGLYGLLRVRGREEPASDHEEILALGDVKLQADGSLSEYLDDTSAMIGRQGPLALVNGASHPVITLPSKGITRLRLVNTANARYFNLSAVGVRFLVAGTDGSQYVEPFFTDNVLIVPGERMDVFLVGPDTGSVELMSLPYERGHGTGDAAALAVATLKFMGGATNPAVRLPSAGASIEPFAPEKAPFRIALSEKTEADTVRFFVNGKQWPEVDRWKLAKGPHQFEVVNESEMDHPFHLHGFFFQVASRDGLAVPASQRVWKDTINVPAKSSFQASANFDEPGRWLYHCHILEHAEAGMMGEVVVE